MSVCERWIEPRRVRSHERLPLARTLSEMDLAIEKLSAHHMKASELIASRGTRIAEASGDRAAAHMSSAIPWEK